MKISITLKYLKPLAKKIKTLAKVIERDLYWGKDDSGTELDISNFTIQELEDLREHLLNIGKETKDELIKKMMHACVQKVVAITKVKQDPLSPIKDLQTMVRS